MFIFSTIGKFFCISSNILVVFLVLNDVDRLRYIFEKAISQETPLDSSSNSIGIQNQTSKETIAVFEANSTPFGFTYRE
jgi:hypothetical protein